MKAILFAILLAVVPALASAETVVFSAPLTIHDFQYPVTDCIKLGQTSLVALPSGYSPYQPGLLMDNTGACFGLGGATLEATVTVPSSVTIPLNSVVALDTNWLVEYGETATQSGRYRVFAYVNGPNSVCDRNTYNDYYFGLRPNVMNSVTLRTPMGCTSIGPGAHALRVIFWRVADYEHHVGRAYFLSATVSILAP